MFVDDWSTFGYIVVVVAKHDVF